MNNVLSLAAQNLWSEINIVSKAETIVMAAPVIIWGAGALEGTVRVTVDVVAIPFATLAGYKSEILERTKKDIKITSGCFVLTGMGALPLLVKVVPYGYFLNWVCRIPFYFAVTGPCYEKIHEQTRNYMNFSYALERAKKNIVYGETGRLAEKVSQDLTDEEFNEVLEDLGKNLGKDPKVFRNDLDQQAMNLHGTMIYNNWSYTITYLTVEKTVKTTVNTASFLWNTAKKIFASGYITGSIKFVGRQIQNEVMYTVNIPGLPEPQGENL